MSIYDNVVDYYKNMSDEDKKEVVQESAEAVAGTRLVAQPVAQSAIQQYANVKHVANQAKPGINTIKKLGNVAKLAGRYSPWVGAALIAEDVYSGVSNAGEVLGTKNPTWKQKVAGAIGGFGHGGTFGVYPEDRLTREWAAILGK